MIGEARRPTATILESVIIVPRINYNRYCFFELKMEKPINVSFHYINGPRLKAHKPILNQREQGGSNI